jgi:hypothetical protein
MTPEGPISPTSVVAQQIVATKAEREAYEEELEEVPAWRVRRRSELKEALARARERERTLLSELGGRPDSESGRPPRP